MPIYPSAMKYKGNKANLKSGKPGRDRHATELCVFLIFLVIYFELSWPSL